MPKTTSANASAHVLLCDGNRSRRHLIASEFRRAGCVVLETSQEHEVTKTLALGRQEWVLAFAEGSLSQHYCDLHPTVPILRLGAGHRQSIAGRASIEGSSNFQDNVHGLVAAHAGHGW